MYDLRVAGSITLVLGYLSSTFIMKKVIEEPLVHQMGSGT